MKNFLLPVTFCLSGFFCFSQTTDIPDEAFEWALIYAGYDDVQDGHVLTANIEHVVELDLNTYPITDLTGIEDFTDLETLRIENIGNVFSPFSLDFGSNLALKHLYAYNAVILSINLSQNIHLETLDISGNLITDLDLSHNSALEVARVEANPYLTSLNVNGASGLTTLYAGWSGLTSIDVTNNPLLQFLDITHNQIASLDLSNNPALQSLLAGTNLLSELDLSNNHELIALSCYQNNLTGLNVKNGNNINMPGSSFYIQDNPELFCVEVDDTDWSTQNWTHKDFHTNYSENCGMGTSDQEFLQLTVYPNPVKDVLHFSEKLNDIEIYSVESKKVLQKTNAESIDVNQLPSGTYFIKARNSAGKEIKTSFIKN